MKKPLSLLLLAVFLSFGLNATAQSEAEKLDLPGDNLNLYAVMKLFQDSETLESFERKLNDEESEVNNLDLDGDGNIDYIRISDNINGKLHTISLKVAVSESEDQDIAVFFVEKKDNGQVLIQLVGDEDLYGKDYIVEPNDGSGNPETPNPGYTGNREPSYSAGNTAVVVSSWPVVRYIFVPNYIVWHSPWRWRYYPSYWRPWRAQYWHYYYGYHYHWRSYYNGHFRRWQYFRNPMWYGHYYGGNYRSRSVLVRTRYARGDYRTTYSRPSAAREGSALFVKRNPKSSASREKLPSFDKTGRPVVTRPAVTRPVSPKPSRERPANKRPAREKPAVTRPSRERPGESRPSRERPATTSPGTGRPATTRPTTPSRNRQESVRPATQRPARESGKPSTSRESKSRERAEPRRN